MIVGGRLLKKSSDEDGDRTRSGDSLDARVCSVAATRGI